MKFAKNLIFDYVLPFYGEWLSGNVPKKGYVTRRRSWVVFSGGWKIETQTPVLHSGIKKWVAVV